MLPTTVPIVDISLGGQARKLYFSFRAWHELGVNPLNPAEMQEFGEALNPMKAAQFIRAGLVGHQALMKRMAEQDGEQPPAIEEWSVDRVLDLLDAGVFAAIVDAVKTATGPAEEAAPEGNE